MEGQNLPAQSYHPLVDLQSEDSIHDYLESVREVIAKCVSVMPNHADFIQQHCAAEKINM